MYLFLGEFEKSIQCFQIMDLEASRAGLIAENKTANYFLAANYQALVKIPVSNTYIKKAIFLAKAIGDSASIFRCQYLYGSNFMYFMTDDSSSFVYHDSMKNVLLEAEKFITNENPAQLGMLNDLYGKAYLAKDDFENCKNHYLLALKYYQQTSEKFNIVGRYINLAQAYSTLEKYDSALNYLLIAEKYIQQDTAFYEGLLSSYFYYSYIVYDGLGQSEKALDYIENYNVETNNIRAGDNMHMLELRENFELQKTNHFIASQKEKTKALYEQKRNFFVYIGLGIGAALIFFGYFINYRYRSRKEREHQKLQLLLQNAELSALKAQMNPHFIFNALNSIQHSILTKNNEEASRFLSKFSKLIRTVLDVSSEQLVSLKSEIETLTLYLDIESKRFDHSFKYQITIKSEEIETDQIQIPPMILQPFIENAIWHGLMPKEGSKELNLTFNVQSEKTIIVELADNGIGRDKARELAKSRNKSHQSKGILNVEERIKLLEQTNGIKVSLEIIDQHSEDLRPTGTKVIVTIKK